jgi:hypothetical protein
VTGPPLAAGSPVDAEETCPVGGETFTITESLSCSFMGDRTMSFRPVSSCDFVTRLPVCPTNRLPHYREFDAGEILKLEALVAGPGYEALRALPDWQRAYAIATHLGDIDGEIGFGLLLSALWYEPAAFFASPQAIAAFEREAGPEYGRASDADRPFLEAIRLYVLIASGRTAMAAGPLATLRGLPDLDPFLSQYLDRLEACRRVFDPESCAPEAPVPNTLP